MNVNKVKACSKCKQDKPIEDYSLDKRKSDGHRSYCKVCGAEATRAWSAANRDRRAETTRVYQAANRERIAEMSRTWYEANKERVAETSRAYRAANRERETERKRAWRKANPKRSAAANRAWYAANRERAAEAQRVWRKANPEKRAEQAARERAMYPDRVAARKAIGDAVRTGRMPPARELTCTTCGSSADQYHHHNGYSRRHWLDVIAVCATCHAELHKEEA